MNLGEATSTASTAPTPTQPDQASAAESAEEEAGKHFAHLKSFPPDLSRPGWPDDAFTAIAPRVMRTFDPRR
jgi:hypothetical protein